MRFMRRGTVGLERLGRFHFEQRCIQRDLIRTVGQKFAEFLCAGFVLNADRYRDKKPFHITLLAL